MVDGSYHSYPLPRVGCVAHEKTIPLPPIGPRPAGVGRRPFEHAERRTAPARRAETIAVMQRQRPVTIGRGSNTEHVPMDRWRWIRPTLLPFSPLLLTRFAGLHGTLFRSYSRFQQCPTRRTGSRGGARRLHRWCQRATRPGAAVRRGARRGRSPRLHRPAACPRRYVRHGRLRRYQSPA